MRTVSPPTDRVVVVGAGLSGLSAALRLAGAGRQVTVLEQAPVPGGRAGLVERAGYRMDDGPTVLTVPGLIRDALACVGEELEDWLQLERLDPAYLARFADGSELRVRTDTAAMAEEVRQVCGPAEAAGYERFVRFAAELYRLEVRRFIDRNLDGPWSLVGPDLARLVAMGGFRRLDAKVASFFRDPRLQRVFSFQSMYAGLAPHQALAIYAVIAYMDTVGGVWFPRGGMHAVPVALAAAAEKHGVAFRYGTRVTRLERVGDRVVAAICADGTRVPGDVFVVTADLPVAERELLGRPPRRLRYSPSCVVLLAGSRASYAGAAHHTITFGAAWRQVFDEVIHQGRLMSDPSLLVTCPTATDPSLAPEGRQSYYVLAPVPNSAARIDWSVEGPRYQESLVSVLERRGWPGFGAGIEVSELITPADWEARGMAMGTPFAAAHTFGQTGPFRPRNLPRGLRGLVWAGSGTTPGVGVPMVLISGRLAAERVLGRDRGYRSSAW